MFYNWTFVETDIKDPTQARGYVTNTVPQALYIFQPDAAIFLSTGSAQHTDLRSIFNTVGWASTFQVPLDNIKALSPPAPANIKENDVGEIVLPNLFNVLFGERP